MGQKTHPVGYRLGYNYTWSSRWYASKDYAKLLHQDIKIRKVVKQKLFHAGVAKVEIERSGDQTRVIINTARPGIIIGRKGAEVDKLKAELEKQYGGQVYITVKEIKKPELDAQLVSRRTAPLTIAGAAGTAGPPRNRHGNFLPRVDQGGAPLRQRDTRAGATLHP